MAKASQSPFASRFLDVDGRHKAGHDDFWDSHEDVCLR
jgi:hypothetical protein